MALKTFVKISGINNLSDARYCAGMEVNLLGFCLDPNDGNYTSPDKFREITEWVSGVSYVGENVLTSGSGIDALANYSLDFIEVPYPYPDTSIFSIGKKVIVQIDLDDLQKAADDLKKYQEQITYVLLSGDETTLSLEDEEVIQKIQATAQSFDVLLGFGINGENVNDLLEKVPIKGIALKGGKEIKPGLKDFDTLADILEALEIDDMADEDII